MTKMKILEWIVLLIKLGVQLTEFRPSGPCQQWSSGVSFTMLLKPNDQTFPVLYRISPLSPQPSPWLSLSTHGHPSLKPQHQVFKEDRRQFDYQLLNFFIGYKVTVQLPGV